MSHVENGEKLHFTYSERDPDNTKANLKQGDILEKTPDLLNLLKAVHPHYLDSQYTHFQVLTQSCDLVRGRKGENCKSRYITLAAVRPLRDIINRLLIEKENYVMVEKVLCCSDKEKQRISAFLKSLFNNQEKDYFFLQKSPTHTITEHSCTMLYLSIAIRAYEHYDLCLEAKRLELKDNFQSRLGWMVGNLYSRVGTDDYVPTAATKEGLDSHIDEILKTHSMWIPSSRFEKFKKKSAGHSGSVEELQKIVNDEINTSKENRVTSIITRLRSAVKIEKEEEEKLKNLIKQDSLLSKLL